MSDIGTFGPDLYGDNSNELRSDYIIERILPSFLENTNVTIEQLNTHAMYYVQQYSLNNQEALLTAGIQLYLIARTKMYHSKQIKEENIYDVSIGMFTTNIYDFLYYKRILIISAIEKISKKDQKFETLKNIPFFKDKFHEFFRILMFV